MSDPMFRQDIADRIVELISAGKFLTDFCGKDDIPDKSTVWRWQDANAEFAAQCARARERSAAENERAVAELGNAVARGELEADAARVKLNCLTWLAKVRAPKVYGDKIDIRTAGPLVIIKDFTGANESSSE